MAAVLPTSAEMISGTQTNAQQKVDLAALVDFAAENINKGTTAGTTTAYTLTLVPALTVLEAGQRFRVKFNAANTTTGPTLDVNGLGAVALKVYGPTGEKESPAVGELAANLLSYVEYDGTDYVVLNPPASRTRLGTPVASTSGTSIDFTAIPSWAKRITLNFSGISVSGSSPLIVQLGDSGGVETSGYLGGMTGFAGSVVTTNFTNGFGLGNSGTSNGVYHGSMVITLLDPATFTWSATCTAFESNQAEGWTSAGSKSTSTVLDRVRITTSGGTDTFDAGKVNILYEG